MPMDVDDTTPSAGNPDTLWVPYFAPDEPDIWSWPNYYYNSYLNDGTNTSNMDTRQERYQKYNNKSVSGDGPHYNCLTRPITPLTNYKQDILDAIDDMNATGNTNISFGMAWGWRVISPTEPFTEGTAYDDKKFRKAIILLTDGDNVIGQTGNHNKSTYSAYGYVKDGRLGVTSAPTADAKLDERTSTVCTNIKNAYPDRPITVYTITFQVNGDATKTLMRNCATDAEKYFDSPSNAELTANFKIIAGELSELRISK
jgi:hypothetical protein